MYEGTIPLPAGVMHVVVIDKENGGKADALNAGINASTTPYFVSLDADSMLDHRALKEMMRVIQEDPRVAGVGGQVPIANGCTIRNSRVVGVGLPVRSLARFQMVEYLRSFTTGRTGLDRMDSILILSGVFAVFEKETVIRAGGYLTPFVRHRITEEYVGHRVGTVCEDMEIVVRLRRFIRDKLQQRRIAFLPIRSPGPKCPRPWSRSGSSGAAGTAACASRSSTTGGCCCAGNTAGSAGSPCRPSGSSSTMDRWWS